MASAKPKAQRKPKGKPKGTPPPRARKPKRASQLKRKQRADKGKKKVEAKLAVRKREQEAVALAASGISYNTIAEQLGYEDRSGAFRAVSRLLRRVEAAAADEYRKLISVRLDDVIRHMWPALMRGESRAANAIVRAEERRARMLGLDLQPGQPSVVNVLMLAMPGRPPRVIRSLRDLDELPPDELAEVARLQGVIELPDEAWEEVAAG